MRTHLWALCLASTLLAACARTGLDGPSDIRGSDAGSGTDGTGDTSGDTSRDVDRDADRDSGDGDGGPTDTSGRDTDTDSSGRDVDTDGTSRDVDADLRDADGGGDPDTGDADTNVRDIDGDSSTDTGDDTGIVANACGGYSPLLLDGAPATVGRPCGACGEGRVVCTGPESIACVGDSANACGGCRELVGDAPGTVCGACGVVGCGRDLNSVECVEPEACAEPLSTVWKLLPSDAFGGDAAASDSFSRSLAFLDGYVLVGTDKDEDRGDNTGAVFVFEKRSASSFVHVETVRAPGAVTLRERFGASLAAASDVLVVGAPDSSRFAGEAGAAFVFVRSDDGTAWTPSRILAPPSPSVGAHFATSIALTDAWLAIGSLDDDETLGSVAVYPRTGTRFGDPLVLTPPSGLRGFGAAVAIGDGTLFVGAPRTARSTDAESFGFGSVAAYRLGAGSTSAVAMDLPPITTASSFGAALAFGDGKLVVGAEGDDEGGADTGSAYVFEVAGGRWSVTQRLRPSTVAVGARFGVAVAIDSTRVVVGAYRENRSVGRSGAVYVFEPGSAGWTETAALDPGASVPAARLGYSLALADGLIFGGAIDDPTAGIGAGAVYVFGLAGRRWETRAVLTSPRSVAGDAFGTAAEMTSTSIVIGAPLADGSVANDGAVHVFRRSPTGWEFRQLILAETPEAEAQLGAALAVSEEWLVVGAPGADGGRGAALVFRLNRAGDWEQDSVISAPDGVAAVGFGAVVAQSTEWLLIGARQNPGAGSSPGVWTYRRVGSRWSPTGWLAAPDTTPGAPFAAAVDGSNAALGAAGGGANHGRVDLFSRSALGSWGLLVADVGGNIGDQYGASVALGSAGSSVRVAAGAPAARGNGTVDTWIQAPATCCLQTLRGTVSGGRFGAAVDAEQSMVVVGEPGGSEGWGDLHVFALVEGAPASAPLGLLETLADARGSVGAELGAVVGIGSGGARVSGGAPGDDEAAPGAGAVLVYE